MRSRRDLAPVRGSHPALTAVVAALAVAALASAVPARAETLTTETGPISVTTFAGGLDHPWSAAFLPDGSMLVTERPGRLRHVSAEGRPSDPISGVPRVYAHGQGGLLGIALDPGFAHDRMVYLAFTEARDGGAAVSVGRGRLNGEMTAIDDFRIIFRQKPGEPGANNFGGRLLFGPDGKLFVTLGDRFGAAKLAQDPHSDIGKVARINPDGSIPADNPFADGKKGAPAVWTYGNRNPEGLAFQPGTHTLWEVEMGPRGGDELNILKPGQNYGWPIVSWGRHYSGEPIPNPPTHPEFTDAVMQWTPVISASGIAFYTGDLFRQWKNNLLLADLTVKAITRLEIDGSKVTGHERIGMGARMRDIVVGPHGAVYALTDEDNGKILKLTPAGK